MFTSSVGVLVFIFYLVFPCLRHTSHISKIFFLLFIFNTSRRGRPKLPSTAMKCRSPGNTQHLDEKLFGIHKPSSLSGNFADTSKRCKERDCCFTCSLNSVVQYAQRGWSCLGPNPTAAPKLCSEFSVRSALCPNLFTLILMI